MQFPNSFYLKKTNRLGWNLVFYWELLEFSLMCYCFPYSSRQCSGLDWNENWMFKLHSSCFPHFSRCQSSHLRTCYSPNFIFLICPQFFLERPEALFCIGFAWNRFIQFSIYNAKGFQNHSNFIDNNLDRDCHWGDGSEPSTKPHRSHPTNFL